MRQALRLALQHGVLVHSHTNGDQATEMALDCLERRCATSRRATTASRCSIASWPMPRSSAA